MEETLTPRGLKVAGDDDIARVACKVHDLLAVVAGFVGVQVLPGTALGVAGAIVGEERRQHALGGDDMVLFEHHHLVQADEVTQRPTHHDAQPGAAALGVGDNENLGFVGSSGWRIQGLAYFLMEMALGC